MKFIGIALFFTFIIAAPAWTQTGKPSTPAELASYTGADRERLLSEGAKREGKFVWVHDTSRCSKQANRFYVRSQISWRKSRNLPRRIFRAGPESTQ